MIRMRFTLRTLLAVPILIGASLFCAEWVSTHRANYSYTELAAVLVVDARTSLPIPGAVVDLTTKNTVNHNKTPDHDDGNDGPLFPTKDTALLRQDHWTYATDNRGIASMAIAMLVEKRQSLLRAPAWKDLQDYDLRISAPGYEESRVRLNDQRRGPSLGSFFKDPIQIRLRRRTR